LILDAGRWAMQEAVRAGARLRAAGLAPGRIAVNVSSIQLRQHDFVRSVEEAIAIADPHGLDLEITESVVMHDIDANVRKLNEVRAKGVDLAIDDFGTGCSSLAYIAQLPISVVKIDRGFVSRLAENGVSESIAATIISLTHALNRQAIAEGVETEAQAALLRKLGCDQYLGYLFSKPVSPAEIERLLVAWATSADAAISATTGSAARLLVRSRARHPAAAPITPDSRVDRRGKMGMENGTFVADRGSDHCSAVCRRTLQSQEP
jgi:EAL domain-containing protein (putative c-di-GMP-specific phosphodiesterase class I)